MSSTNSLRRRWRPVAAILIAFGTASITGCAATPDAKAPVVSKAALGKVIIYRNGVAFFERYAPPHEKELTLRVPAERVDDFLKSLTIIDKRTGDTMPVSYPNRKRTGDEVEMTIGLPKKHNGLTISYVTESPAWKPSYRIVLGKDNKAKLQGWAIVDNVSGEDWEQVHIGVGSTSALSFRYDLHSVKNVHRETLAAGSLLAVAPPTGGVSYASTPEAKKPVVVALSSGSVAQLRREQAPPAVDAGDAFGDGIQFHHGRGTGTGTTAMTRQGPAAGKAGMAKRARPKSAAGRAVSGLSRRLIRNKNERILIEGYARPGDKAPQAAALSRANTVRDTLIAQGVRPEQIEATGNGAINDNKEVQVVQLGTEEDQTKRKALAEPKPTEANAPGQAVADGDPLGQAHFVSRQAMTIKKGHSAMVSIVQKDTVAERVYYYDPISERGSDKFAFNAVRVENPSEYTLDSGPITVYEDSQFLGEGMAEPILPKSSAFIPYALDRTVVVEPDIDNREEIDRLVTIQRGIVATESRSIRSTKLVLHNRGQNQATVYVRHKVAAGHELSTTGQKMPAPVKMGGAHLFQVTVPAGARQELVIEEWTPVKRTVDIRTDHGIRAISLYLKKAKLNAKLSEGLKDVVKKYSQRADLEEKITTLSEQQAVYRTRVDELTHQLKTLRKVKTAAKLRQHLSTKMEEISQLLQNGTIKLADLKAQLMTQRIALQDRLAELTLKDERDDALAHKD